MAKYNPPTKQKYIESPEAMEILFEQYKEDLKEQAKEWVKVQYVGKDGDRMTDNMKVPFTMEGFRRFGHSKGVTIKDYFDNKDNRYDAYTTICSRIRDEIRENQIVGGLLGVHNASITQRLNGLKEQTTTEHSGTLNIPLLPNIGKRK